MIGFLKEIQGSESTAPQSWVHICCQEASSVMSAYEDME